MVSISANAQPEKLPGASRLNGNGHCGAWRMVGSYPTVEQARTTANQLAADGIESTISMIGGLCVIAREG